MTDKVTESKITEMIKLWLNHVPIEEISTQLNLPIPQITQSLLINKKILIDIKLNNNELFEISKLPITSISLNRTYKNGNVYGVERNIKFLFPEIDVKDFLQKYYVTQKLSPDEICKVVGFGSQKGWINIVQKYGLARSRKEAQNAKWTTDRGKRHLEKLKPHLELVTGHGSRKSLSPKLRWEILEKYEFTCQACGRMPPEAIIEVEHINPIRDKGRDEPSNLTVLCDVCNIGKYHSEKHKKLERAKKIENAKAIYKKKLFDTYNYKVDGKD